MSRQLIPATIRQNVYREHDQDPPDNSRNLRGRMIRNRNQLQPDSDRQVNEGNAPDQHRDPRRDVVEDLQKFQVIFVLLGRHDHHFQKTGSPCGPTLPDRDPELDCCTSTGNLRSPPPLAGLAACR